MVKSTSWDFEEFGFKIINWSFPKNDTPHCETVLKINTGLEQINDETYSFSGSPLPWCGELEFLKNMKKSAELAIEEIEKTIKEYNKKN